MKFYLTDLGGDRFILGYPFLYTFNPNVNWCRAQLRGGLVQLEMASFHKAEQQVNKCQKEACRTAGQVVENDEIWVRCSTVAQQWACNTHQDEGEKTLPIEYQQHRRVFDEECAKRFPLERDSKLEIPLLPNTPKVLDCKVYPLIREERDLLQTFLVEEQDKGYIYLGSSPYATLVFFISKKDSDEKRIIMDYCQLNEWMV